MLRQMKAKRHHPLYMSATEPASKKGRGLYCRIVRLFEEWLDTAHVSVTPEQRTAFYGRLYDLFREEEDGK